MPAILGDFLTAASEHLEAAVVVGDGQLTELPAVARGLHRLVAVMSHYMDDLAPCDEVEASTWSSLHAWERAVIDAGEALRTAAGCLHRSAPEPGDQASSTASWRARHLAAAAANLAAGRDLLHTHRAPNPDGLMQDRSEWAPVVTSLPVTRALADDITRWSSRLAPFTAWLAGSATSYPLPHTPDQAVSAAVRDELVSVSQWLHVARAAVGPAAGSDPVRTTDAELLHAIPAVSIPDRHPPSSAGESVAELCDGIAISAARLRAVIRGSQEQARWSPLITSGGWQWMAHAAAVTSHLSELALRSLADRARRIPRSPATGTQLDNAADRLVGMRTAWQGAGRMWDAMFTESRLLETPAMTEAADLTLRMGRLVWDNPRWTPARADRAPRRTPVALAPGPAAVNAVVAAAHQAVDALVHVAMTDIQTIKAADQAGRLYVTMRSLSGDDKPRPYATAPAERYRTIHNAYRAALNASIKAAQELDLIALTAGAPSTALALARAATSVQAHRRIRLDHDNLRDPPPTGSTFFINTRVYTGKAGSLERAMIDRGISDPVILLRATAIDNAARRLIIEAENTKSESGASDAHESRQPSAHGAVELAAQDFPQGPATGPSTGIRHIEPGRPAAPATAPRAAPGRRSERLKLPIAQFVRYKRFTCSFPEVDRHRSGMAK